MQLVSSTRGISFNSDTRSYVKEDSTSELFTTLGYLKGKTVRELPTSLDKLKESFSLTSESENFNLGSPVGRKDAESLAD